MAIKRAAHFSQYHVWRGSPDPARVRWRKRADEMRVLMVVVEECGADVALKRYGAKFRLSTAD
jgi:hypothetical protein